jgi:hypothetical protein
VETAVMIVVILAIALWTFELAGLWYTYTVLADAATGRALRHRS